MMDNFQNWLKQPFSADMSATRWLAFVGLVLAIMLFWGVVLRRLESL